jgi:S-formylglutathione hydrolase FrmB
VDYDTLKRYPVVYLLHGYGGDSRSWLGIHGGLLELSSRYGMLLVCPDGSNSWYYDSPVNIKSRYESFILRELISYIDTRYSTVSYARGRAITGYSMGGHGGLWLGFRHVDVFGACGSSSGGVDVRPFPSSWDLVDVLGEFRGNEKRWNAHMVVNQIDLIKDHPPVILIDCGTEDFFYMVNVSLHSQLLESRIPHTFLSLPGGHDPSYWRRSIEYQLLFFHTFFSGTK